MATKTTKKKNNPVNKMTAAQKLTAVSGVVAQHHEKFDILADEIDKLSNLIVHLNKRINAVLEAGDGGTINKESVGNILLDEAVSNLKSKVDELLQLKAIVASESGEISDERFFVVARELDGEGNVVNPRTQFAVLSLPNDELKAKFIGQKVGSVIGSEDSDVTVEILEVYALADLDKKEKIEEPKLEEAAQ